MGAYVCSCCECMCLQLPATRAVRVAAMLTRARYHQLAHVRHDLPCPRSPLLTGTCRWARAHQLWEQARAAGSTAAEPLPPTLDEQSNDASEYASKYATKADNVGTNDAVLAIAHLVAAAQERIAHTALQPADAAIGRRWLAKAINAAQGSMTVPAALAATYALGYGDSRLSHRTQPFDHRAFVSFRQLPPSDVLEAECMVDAVQGANQQASRGRSACLRCSAHPEWRRRICCHTSHTKHGGMPPQWRESCSASSARGAPT